MPPSGVYTHRWDRPTLLLSRLTSLYLLLAHQMLQSPSNLWDSLLDSRAQDWAQHSAGGPGHPTRHRGLVCVQLVECFLTWFSSTKDTSSLLQTFPLVQGIYGLWRTMLPVKTKVKVALSTWAFSMPFTTQGSCPLQQQTHALPSCLLLWVQPRNLSCCLLCPLIHSAPAEPFLIPTLWCVRIYAHEQVHENPWETLHWKVSIRLRAARTKVSMLYFPTWPFFLPLLKAHQQLHSRTSACFKHMLLKSHMKCWSHHHLFIYIENTTEHWINGILCICPARYKFFFFFFFLDYLQGQRKQSAVYSFKKAPG